MTSFPSAQRNRSYMSLRRPTSSHTDDEEENLHEDEKFDEVYLD